MGVAYFSPPERGGKPQIYRVDLATGGTQRVTWDGDKNLGASMSPDGKSMVMVSQVQGQYQLPDRIWNLVA